MYFNTIWAMNFEIHMSEIMLFIHVLALYYVNLIG